MINNNIIEKYQKKYNQVLIKFKKKFLNIFIKNLYNKVFIYYL